MSARALAILVVAGAAACTPSPHLAVSAQPIVDLPSDGDFGSVQVGQSATQTFTIGPASGLQMDEIEAIALVGDCPAFKLDAENLPAQVFTVCTGDTGGQGYGCGTFQTQTYAFTATFRPVVASQTSCVIQLTINGGTRTIGLTGTGTAPPIVVSVPGSLAFGDVRVAHASQPTPLVVRNRGSGLMTVTSVTADSARFPIGVATGNTVPAGSSLAYPVTCEPTALGPLTGTITVVTDDPLTPSVTVPVSCTGIDAQLDVESPITLADTRLGESVTHQAAITIDGDTALVIEAVAVTGDGLAITQMPPLGTAIPPTADPSPVSLTLAWTPTLATADVAGTLTITYDGGKVRAAPIHGAALATHLSIDPDGRVDFGPVCAGHSAVRSFHIGADQLGGFTVTGVDAAPPFALTLGDGSPIALPVAVPGGGAGSGLAFDVTASPTDGVRSSTTLVVTTDVPGAPHHDVTLFVTGILDGVTTTPSVLNFGTPVVGGTPEPKDVTLTNCTDGPLALGSATIVDDDDGDFSITAQPDGAVPAGAAAVYTIAMAPRANGVKLANLVVGYGSGSATIPLAGTATGGKEVTAPTGPASYYACAAGGGGGGAMWPLGVVLLWRRRRRGEPALSRAAS